VEVRVSWYYPKGWTDSEDGIEQVLIHYVCTPPTQWPDWGWGHETRVLQDLGGYPPAAAQGAADAA
jgi:hypothetical protein